MKYTVHAGLWMARWTDDITPILKTVADLGYDNESKANSLSTAV